MKVLIIGLLLFFSVYQSEGTSEEPITLIFRKSHGETEVLINSRRKNEKEAGEYIQRVLELYRSQSFNILVYDSFSLSEVNSLYNVLSVLEQFRINY